MRIKPRRGQVGDVVFSNEAWSVFTRRNERPDVHLDGYPDEHSDGHADVRHDGHQLELDWVTRSTSCTTRWRRYNNIKLQSAII